MKRILTFIFILIAGTALSNDSLAISRLLSRISQLQPVTDGVFPKGSIPSYRLYALNKNRYKADINPFFTGLVAFTLQDIRRDLSPAQQQQADIIIRNTLPSLDKFENRKRSNTYNFWNTDKPQIFPNSGWLNWFDKSQSLPDDLDDTVIILMAQQEKDSVAKEVHTLMQGFANNSEKQVRNTFDEYKHIGAYSTWFGKKMPVDFDVCVLANVLYFVQHYNLRWTAADSASLELIDRMITDGRHISAASYMSPHYATTPIILYHISRLMSLKPIPALEKHKALLIENTKRELTTAKTFMDEVILGTALLRWGVAPPDTRPHQANSLEELIEEEGFSFFIANMASMMPDTLKKWMTSIKLGQFYYYAPAYNHVLLVENLVWRKRRGL